MRVPRRRPLSQRDCRPSVVSARSLAADQLAAAVQQPSPRGQRGRVDGTVGAAPSAGRRRGPIRLLRKKEASARCARAGAASSATGRPAIDRKGTAACSTDGHGRPGTCTRVAFRLSSMPGLAATRELYPLRAEDMAMLGTARSPVRVDGRRRDHRLGCARAPAYSADPSRPTAAVDAAVAFSRYWADLRRALSCHDHGMITWLWGRAVLEAIDSSRDGWEIDAQNRRDSALSQPGCPRRGPCKEPACRRSCRCCGRSAPQIRRSTRSSSRSRSGCSRRQSRSARLLVASTPSSTKLTLARSSGLRAGPRTCAHGWPRRSPRPDQLDLSTAIRFSGRSEGSCELNKERRMLPIRRLLTEYGDVIKAASRACWSARIRCPGSSRRVRDSSTWWCSTRRPDPGRRRGRRDGTRSIGCRRRRQQADAPDLVRRTQPGRGDR